MSNSAFTPSVLTITQSGTTGSGQGELNVISNPSAVTDLSGWTATGLTPSRDTSGSPLDPTVPTGFSLSTSASGQTYVSTVTVPASLRNRKLKLEFYFSQSTSSYKVDVLNSSSVRFPLTTDVSSVSNIPAISGGSKYTTYFDMDSGSTISVQFTSIASSGVLKFTQLIVGPGIQPQGAVVGEWQSYTPTGPWTANTTYTGKYRRIGDSIELVVDLALSGAPTSTFLIFTEAQILNGLNLTIDSTKFPISSDFAAPVGTWSALDSGVSGSYGGHVTWNGSQLFVAYPTGINSAVIMNATTPITFGSADNVSLRAILPISQWAGSGTVQLAQNDVEYAWNNSTTDADDPSSFGYGPSGNTVPNISGATNRVKRVRFQTPIQTTDIITIEVKPGSSGEFSTFLAAPSGLTTGISWTKVNATDIDVTFGFSGNNANTAFGTATWATRNSSNWTWRVRKSSAGAAVGFGVVNSVSTGLVTPMTPQTALTFSASTPAATIVRAVGIAYTDIGGIWRLRFNIVYDVAIGNRNISTVTLSGTTFKNFVNFAQPVTVACSAGALKQQAYTASNAGIITVEHESATTSRYHLSGDVELESKPTWA